MFPEEMYVVISNFQGTTFTRYITFDPYDAVRSIQEANKIWTGPRIEVWARNEHNGYRINKKRVVTREGNVRDITVDDLLNRVLADIY